MIRTLLLAAATAIFAACAAAQPAASTAAPAAGALSNDTVLIRNSRATVTKADYDAELLRVPADIRSGFNTVPSRVSNLVNSLATTKTLAAEARAKGLDRDAETQRRIASEVERILAAALIAQFEADAGREFDARPGIEQFARERYLVGKERYKTPEQVTVTHLLFEVPKHNQDDALKLAQDARAKVLAGADMNALARAISEDPSAKRNDGRIDWFTADAMDPAFSKAAFGLKNVGDVSEPIQSRYGYHVIRLDGRKPGGVRPYDEVKAEIIADARRQYIDQRRVERVTELRNDPRTEINDPAIEALVARPDSELLKKAHEVLPGKP